MYNIPAVYKVSEAQILGLRERSAIFPDGERISMDRKYHLKGAPVLEIDLIERNA